jgi:hypothetical protein
VALDVEKDEDRTSDLTWALWEVALLTRGRSAGIAAKPVVREF